MGLAKNLRERRLGSIRRRRDKDRRAMMSMVDHLGELRTRLIRSSIVFIVFSAAAFTLFGPISDFLLEPLCSVPRDLLGPNGCRLNAFGVLEPLNVRLKVAALSGMVASLPFWLYQIYAFVVPGLTAKERSYAIPFVLSTATLFSLGCVLAYLTMPAAIRFLVGLGAGQVIPLFRAQDYLNFVGLILIAFGLTFELPALVFFLGLAGILPLHTLRGHRKHALVATFVLSAVVTPSQDPFTMSAMAVALYALFELTILLLAAVERRRDTAPSS